MAREYPLTFYNVDNYRDPGEVTRELRALLEPRPAVLGLCETTGYDLPAVDGYRVLRDRSRPGRDNVAAYVKTNLDVSNVKWLDLHETWTRTNPGAHGQHPPRSILEFRAGRLRVWVAHAPPKGTDNVKASQREHTEKLAARLTPWRNPDWGGNEDAARAQARVILWDANRQPGEGDYGPDTLARTCGATNVGTLIDLGTWRGTDISYHRDPVYFDHVAGVDLYSDHGHAFRFTLALHEP